MRENKSLDIPAPSCEVTLDLPVFPAEAPDMLSPLRPFQIREHHKIVIVYTLSLEWFVIQRY